MTRQGEASLFIKHISCKRVIENIKYEIKHIRTEDILKDIKRIKTKIMRVLQDVSTGWMIMNKVQSKAARSSFLI